MRNILLKCTKRRLVDHCSIYSFVNEEGYLDMKPLLIYFFQHLDLSLINQTESWINCGRNSNIKVPSEKIYQFSIFQTLCALCPTESEFKPILEMNRRKGRVDLAILTSKGKYLIELAANVQDFGDHSAESHYTRQATSYHFSQDTIQSSVVVVANYLKNDYSPELQENIDYIEVIQFKDSESKVSRNFTFIYNKNEPETFSVKI